MKNNLKNRLTAFLLCLVMLFSVASAAKNPTQSSTPTTSASGEAEAPSVAPANGAETIVNKTVKLYHSAEKVEDVTVEHLADTHYPFYETIRKKHPEIPYVMISRPDFFRDPINHAKRRAVILESYNRAIASGDKNVYYIDGETLFQGDCAESCTSDGCHPNDLGFYRMADRSPNTCCKRDKFVV